MFKIKRNSSVFNLILLITLIIIIYIIPVFDNYSTAFGLYEIFMTILLILMIFVIQTNRKKLIVIIIFSVVLSWISSLFDIWVVEVISKICNILFLILIVVMLIVQVAKSKKVTANVILESINGYLLLGLVGAIFIMLVERFHTGSFSFPDTVIHFSDTIYLSFVTMTTLGYGDIHAVSDLARSVSIFLSVSGQMYLTILVALLVGKFLVQYTARER